VRLITTTFATACVLASLAVQGCSTQQLQGFNQQLADLNQGLAPSENLAPPMPQLTVAQQQQLLAQINQPQTKLQLRVAVQQAAPTIQKVLQFLACSSNINPGHYLTQYSTRSAVYVTPISQMKYASNTQCLTVERIDGWKMPALNALSFRVLYMSPISGEGVRQQMTMIKEPSGIWLFTTVYW
jgi:hypothetical protein